MTSEPDKNRAYPVRQIPKTTVWADSTPLEDIGQPRQRLYSRRRIRLGLIITLAGYVILLIGARPSLFGLDRSPVVGFVQIATLLVGLGIICFGGYISMMALWKNTPINIPADIGLRLVATGYVISVFAGMADIFGAGSDSLAGLIYFGRLQALGVVIGQAVIAIGFFMMIPYSKLSLPPLPPVEPEAEDQKPDGPA